MLQDVDLGYVAGVLTSGHQAAAVSYAASGLTGATAASRYVGAIASGTAPASGTFLTGDWMIVQSGGIIVCTAGGSQGTWAFINGTVGLPPSGDTTGATDPGAIQALLNLGGRAVLQPGTFYFGGSSALSMSTASTMIQGAGIGTQLQITAGFSAAEVISVAANSCTVRDLGIVGASSTVASNPACNGIELNGYQHCRFDNLWFQYVNGWCIEAVGGASAANVDLMIGRIVGRNVAAGIHVKGVTGTSFLGEHFLTDIQLQQVGAASGANANLDAMLIEDVSDVLVQGVNIGIAAGTTGGAIHIKGACATVAVTNPDVGANQTSGSGAALHIESSGNGSPSGITINGGSVEGGSAAIQVDAGNDVTLNGVRAHQAYTDGLQVNGSAAEVMAIGCSFAANNQSGTTGYDINCGSMTGGNFRAVSCRLETTVGTTTAGDVTNPVSTSTHGYYYNCFFIASNNSPSTVFTGTAQIVKNCVGYNPRGSVTPATIGSSPYTPGGYQTDLSVIFTAVNGMTSFQIGGTTVASPPQAGVPYHVPARQSMTVVWATTAPTWIWLGE